MRTTWSSGSHTLRICNGTSGEEEVSAGKDESQKEGTIL